MRVGRSLVLMAVAPPFGDVTIKCHRCFSPLACRTLQAIQSSTFTTTSRASSLSSLSRTSNIKKDPSRDQLEPLSLSSYRKLAFTSPRVPWLGEGVIDKYGPSSSWIRFYHDTAGDTAAGMGNTFGAACIGAFQGSREPPPWFHMPAMALGKRTATTMALIAEEEEGMTRENTLARNVPFSTSWKECENASTPLLLLSSSSVAQQETSSRAEEKKVENITTGTTSRKKGSKKKKEEEKSKSKKKRNNTLVFHSASLVSTLAISLTEAGEAAQPPTSSTTVTLNCVAPLLCSVSSPLFSSLWWVRVSRAFSSLPMTTTTMMKTTYSPSLFSPVPSAPLLLLPSPSSSVSTSLFPFTPSSADRSISFSSLCKFYWWLWKCVVLGLLPVKSFPEPHLSRPEHDHLSGTNTMTTGSRNHGTEPEEEERVDINMNQSTDADGEEGNTVAALNTARAPVHRRTPAPVPTPRRTPSPSHKKTKRRVKIMHTTKPKGKHMQKKTFSSSARRSETSLAHHPPHRVLASPRRRFFAFRTSSLSDRRSRSASRWRTRRNVKLTTPKNALLRLKNALFPSSLLLLPSFHSKGGTPGSTAPRGEHPSSSSTATTTTTASSSAVTHKKGSDGTSSVETTPVDGSKDGSGASSAEKKNGTTSPALSSRAIRAARALEVKQYNADVEAFVSSGSCDPISFLGTEIKGKVEGAPSEQRAGSKTTVRTSVEKKGREKKKDSSETSTDVSPKEGTTEEPKISFSAMHFTSMMEMCRAPRSKR